MRHRSSRPARLGDIWNNIFRKEFSTNFVLSCSPLGLGDHDDTRRIVSLPRRDVVSGMTTTERYVRAVFKKTEKNAYLKDPTRRACVGFFPRRNRDLLTFLMRRTRVSGAGPTHIRACEGALREPSSPIGGFGLFFRRVLRKPCHLFQEGSAETVTSTFLDRREKRCCYVDVLGRC